MSLRTRVAIAVGAVVFGALAVVAAVVYPAVGANLRGQDDASLTGVSHFWGCGDTSFERVF
jgi:hypothetical protein